MIYGDMLLAFEIPGNFVSTDETEEEVIAMVNAWQQYCNKYKIKLDILNVDVYEPTIEQLELF